jgi:hypothetical protein
MSALILRFSPSRPQKARLAGGFPLDAPSSHFATKPTRLAVTPSHNADGLWVAWIEKGRTIGASQHNKERC